MKSAVKLALIGAALIGGVANAANINTLPTASTGSSLVVLLKGTDGTFYVEEIAGANVVDIKSVSALTSAGAGQYAIDGTGVAGTLTVPQEIASFSSANLATYLTTHSNATWTIIGGNRGDMSFNTGAQSIALTSAEDYLAEFHYVVGNDVNGAAQGVNNFFLDDINVATYTNNVSTEAGWGDTNEGTLAPNSFIGAYAPNGAEGVGTSQYLYLLTTSSQGAGANVYKSAAQITLNANGTFTYTAADLEGPPAAVPVPAALWLLGSGLLGLVGVGRRSNKAAA